MGNLNKSFAVALILIVAVSSLMMAKSTVAQSTTKPSTPGFTLKNVEHPYDVPPTYSIDQYTGKNVMTSAGYHVENKSIEVTITNQAFSSSSNSTLYYNVRVKGHYGQQWTSIYQCSNYSLEGEYIPRMLSATTNSPYTIMYYSIAENSSGDQFDFQVAAATMHEGQIKTYAHFMDFNLITVPAMVLGEVSDWSNTQTITIPEDAISSSTSPTETSSPTPTTSPFQSQNPTTTPNQPAAGSTATQVGLNWIEIALFAILGVVIVLLGLVIMYMRKKIGVFERKLENLEKIQ